MTANCIWICKRIIYSIAHRMLNLTDVGLGIEFELRESQLLRFDDNGLLVLSTEYLR